MSKNLLLKNARKAKGWSQKLLADLAVVSLSTIERAERGEPLRIDNIKRICKCLEKEPHELGLIQLESEVSHQDLFQESSNKQSSLLISSSGFILSDDDPLTNENNLTHRTHMYANNLELMSYLIEQTWYLRKVAPMPQVEQNVKRLFDLFRFYQTQAPPPTELENRYLQLFAQTHRLAAVIHVENKRYPTAISHYEKMFAIGQGIHDPTTIALALLGKGAELERMGKQQEAVDCLEFARDQTFQTRKEVASLVNAYLARTYASNHESQQFLRAIDTAQSIAVYLGEKFGSAKDFAYYSISGVLAERSYGYLEIGEPRKTLAMRDEIIKSIHINENTWLHAWIPLDWARAYLMIGEIEECIRETREFYTRANLLQSPHTTARAEQMIEVIKQAGHADISAVKNFTEEIEDLKAKKDREARE